MASGVTRSAVAAAGRGAETKEDDTKKHMRNGNAQVQDVRNVTSTRTDRDDGSSSGISRSGSNSGNENDGPWEIIDVVGVAAPTARASIEKVRSTAPPEPSSTYWPTARASIEKVRSTAPPEPSSTYWPTARASIEKVRSTAPPEPSSTYWPTARASIEKVRSMAPPEPSSTYWPTARASIEKVRSMASPEPSSTYWPTARASIEKVRSMAPPEPSSTYAPTARASIEKVRSTAPPEPSSTYWPTTRASIEKVRSMASPEPSSTYWPTARASIEKVRSTAAPEPSSTYAPMARASIEKVGSTTTPEPSSIYAPTARASIEKVRSMAPPEPSSTCAPTAREQVVSVGGISSIALDPAVRFPHITLVNKAQFLPVMKLQVSPEGMLMQPAPKIRFSNLRNESQYAVWISFIQDSGLCAGDFMHPESPRPGSYWNDKLLSFSMLKLFAFDGSNRKPITLMCNQRYFLQVSFGIVKENGHILASTVIRQAIVDTWFVAVNDNNTED